MAYLTLERLPAVLARRSDGRSSLYADINLGRWTPPIRMGRASAWPEHETQALLRARIAGASDEQLKQLVRDLLEERKSALTALSPAAPGAGA